MLALKIQHHKTFIINATKQDLELVQKALTVFKQRYNPNPHFVEKEWDITYLLDTKNFSFPTAYLDEVIKFANEKNIEITKRDERTYKSFTIPKLELKTDLSLREEQIKAFHKIQEEPTGIIMMPTASGKSRVITKAIDSKKVRTLIIVPRQNLQTQLAKQLKEAFGNSRVDTQIPYQLKQRIEQGFANFKGEDDVYDEDHVLRKDPTKLKIKLDDSLYTEKTGNSKKSLFDEITTTKPNKIKFQIDMDAFESNKSKIEDPEMAYIKDKKSKLIQKKIANQKSYQQKKLAQWKDPNYKLKIKYKDIYVFCDASLPSLPTEFLEQFEMIVIDECHHAAAKMIRDGLLRMPKACYRYYFSATPWRDHSAEEKLLASAIGTKILFELTPEEAILYKNIAKPVYEQVNSPEPKNFMQDKKKWRDILEFGIIGNNTRNAKIVDIALSKLDENKNVFITVDEISHIEILAKRFEQLKIEVDTIHGEKPRKENESLIEKVGKRTSGICIGTMSVGEGTDMPNIDVVILASGGKSSIRLLQRIGRGARKGTDQSKVLFEVFDFFDWFHPTLIRHSMKRKQIFEEYYQKLD